MGNQMLELDINTLIQWKKDKKEFAILDVREDSELEICSVEGAIHVPLGRLIYGEYEGLPREKTLVVMCHHGRRSLQAVLFLRDQGYTNALSLKGGIHAWAEEIDSHMRKY